MARSKRSPSVGLRTVRVWQYAAKMAMADAMPYHGDCLSPITHEVRGSEDWLLVQAKAFARQWNSDFSSLDAVDDNGSVRLLGKWREDAVRTASGFVSVRCRKCQACLDYRRRLWTAKAIAETRLARRTWFVTLTYAPPARVVAQAKADAACRRTRSERLEMLTPRERFQQICNVTGKDVTNWLKRIRKNSRARLRYILVTEAHSDGFPHYHLLVHETDNGSVSKRVLQLAWREGFSHARLVDARDAKAVGYVCKYLAKDASTRIRGSIKYGRPSGAALAEAVSKIVDALPRRHALHGNIAYPLPHKKNGEG